MTRVVIVMSICLLCGTSAAQQPLATGTLPKAVLVNTQRIWDQAPHNAFTDLIRFRGSWFCVFREGTAHVSPDGALRILKSQDGKQWESAALVTSPTSDLRDAKISITPDNRMMLAGAEAVEVNGKKHHQTLTWFSENGTDWSDSHEVADRNFWLWRITWHQDKAYGFGYGCGDAGKGLRFYETSNGTNFTTVIPAVEGLGTYPSETSMVFLEDDTALCLLRQDGEPKSGLLGTSKPPYSTWNWKSLGVRVGGPDMIQLKDGRIIAVVRLYDNKVRTSVCWLDPQTAKLTEALALPSGGDTSYAGLVWHNEMLWISYYSSHEGKTGIYLSQVRFE